MIDINELQIGDKLYEMIILSPEKARISSTVDTVVYVGDGKCESLNGVRRTIGHNEYMEYYKTKEECEISLYLKSQKYLLSMINYYEKKINSHKTELSKLKDNNKHLEINFPEYFI